MIAERLDRAKIVFGLKGELAVAIDQPPPHAVDVVSEVRVSVEENGSRRDLAEDALGDVVQDPLRSLESVHGSSLRRGRCAGGQKQALDEGRLRDRPDPGQTAVRDDRRHRHHPVAVGCGGDVGGGGSELTWQLYGSLRYAFSRRFGLGVGYRILGVDYAANGNDLELTQHGLVTGLRVGL